MFRSARLVMAFCGLFAFTSCAYVMYPERHGQRPNGVIDTMPLVIDILWFIPGLLPGVICLVVDFTSGAIYVPGGYGKLKVRGNGKIVANRPPVTETTQARLALVDATGQVYAEQSTVWSPEHSKREDKIRLDIPEEARIAHAEGHQLSLEVQLGDTEPAVFALELGPNAG
jgi:hypothetical protein